MTDSELDVTVAELDSLLGTTLDKLIETAPSDLETPEGPSWEAVLDEIERVSSPTWG